MESVLVYHNSINVIKKVKLLCKVFNYALVVTTNYDEAVFQYANRNICIAVIDLDRNDGKVLQTIIDKNNTSVLTVGILSPFTAMLERFENERILPKEFETKELGYLFGAHSRKSRGE